jgi:hypothetical protein
MPYLWNSEGHVSEYPSAILVPSGEARGKIEDVDLLT